MHRPVIIHADDFGETVEITAGICQAIEAGAVTSTTIMANMPGTQDALRRVASLSDRASFGVHLNFCEGKPLTVAPSLVGADGQFYRKRMLFRRSMARALVPAELEAEISAQIALVRDAGVRISHVDGHKHLHQLPMVATAVAAVLPRFGIERVRVTRLRTLRAVGSPATFMREILGWRASRRFAHARLRSPARVLDIQTLMRSPHESLRQHMPRAGQGTLEVFCHPGTAQADREKPGSCRRSEELQFLLSPAFRERLAASDATPATYWDI